MKTKPAILIAFLFVAMTATGQNPRNSLIEKGSSTWCDECICIDSIIQHCVIPEYPRTIMLIYHNFMSLLKCDMCDTVARYLLQDGSEVRINRDGQAYKIYGFENFYQYCDTLGISIKMHPEAPLQLSVTSKTYDSQSRKVTIGVEARPYDQAMEGTFLVNAVVYEDMVLASQSMSSECGGFSGKRPCYHNQVVRTMAYQFGDQVKSGSWAVSDAVAREFSFDLDAAWDPYHTFIVVYVYKQTESLVNSEVQQAIVQSVTGSLPVVEKPTDPVGILNIYPNPSTDKATANLRVSSDGFVSISITDMQGRTIRKIAGRELNKGVYDVDFITAGLAAGQYNFTIEKESRIFQRTFTVTGR